MKVSNGNSIHNNQTSVDTGLVALITVSIGNYFMFSVKIVFINVKEIL